MLWKVAVSFLLFLFLRFQEIWLEYDWLSKTINMNFLEAHYKLPSESTKPIWLNLYKDNYHELSLLNHYICNTYLNI